MNLQHVASLTFALGLGLSLAMPTALWADSLAHSHGTANVDVFIDNTTLSLQLSSPLANLLGFEYSPRTPEQQKKTEELLDELSRPLQLVNIDPAGGCQFIRTVTTAKVLTVQPPTTAYSSKAPEAHANLQATFEYKCSSPARIEYVNLPLISRYKGIERIHVQLVTPKAQGGQTLVKPTQRVTIPR